MDAKLALALLSFIVVVHGEFLTRPQNQAAYVGSRVVIHVQVHNFHPYEQFEWWDRTNITQDHPQGRRIYSTRYSSEPIPSGYEIDRDDAKGTVNLVLPSLQRDQAGTYYFREAMAPTDHRVEVVALDPLACSPAPGSIEQYEHAEVFLDGVMGFKGALGPVMSWSSPETDTLETFAVFLEEEEIGKVVKYRANVTARPDLAGVNFTNRVYFAHTFLNDSFEFFPPNFTEYCHTDFEVMYTPRNFIITPDPDDYPEGLVMKVGDYFNCSASARPEAEIMWRRGDGDKYYMSEWLPITADMVGQNNSYFCQAQHQYSGQFVQREKEVFFMAENPDSAEAVAGMAPWSIALAVCIPVLAVGTAAGVGGYLYYKRQKAAKDGKEGGAKTKKPDLKQFQKPVALGRSRFPPGYNPENRTSRPISGHPLGPPPGPPGRRPLSVEVEDGKAKQRNSHINKMVPENPTNGFTPGQVSRHSSTGNVSRHSVGLEQPDVSGAIDGRAPRPEQKPGAPSNLPEKQAEVRRSQQNLLQKAALSQADPMVRRSQQNLAGTDMQVRGSKQNLAGSELRPAGQMPVAPLRKSQQNLANPALRTSQPNIAEGSMPVAPLRRSRQNLTDQALRLSQQNLAGTDLKPAVRKSAMDLGDDVDNSVQNAQYKAMLRRSQENLFKMSQQAMKTTDSDVV